MPTKYKASDDEMDESYGAPVTPPEEGESAPAAGKQSVDEQEAASDTAIISNKILSPDGEPLKEGDEIVLQVVKNYGDESEVKYAPHKGGEEEEEPEAPETPSPGEELAALDMEKA